MLGEDLTGGHLRTGVDFLSLAANFVVVVVVVVVAVVVVVGWILAGFVVLALVGSPPVFAPHFSQNFEPKNGGKGRTRER